MRDRYTFIITIKTKIFYIIIVSLLAVISTTFIYIYHKSNKNTEELKHGDLVIVNGEPRKVVTNYSRPEPKATTKHYIYTMLPYKGNFNKWEVYFRLYKNEPNPKGVVIIDEIIRRRNHIKTIWDMEFDSMSWNAATTAIFVGDITNLSAEVTIESNGKHIMNYDAYQMNYEAEILSVRWQDIEMVQAYRTGEAIVAGYFKYIDSVDYEQKYSNLIPIIYVQNAAKRMIKRNKGVQRK